MTNASTNGMPLWVIIIILLSSVLLTFLKEAKNFKGLFGAPARWWDSRQVRAVERDEALEAANERVLQQRLAHLVDPIERRLKIVERDLEAARHELEETRTAYEERIDLLQERIELRDEWGSEMAYWVFNASQEAASQGFRLRDGWMSFSEWHRKRQEKLSKN